MNVGKKRPNGYASRTCKSCKTAKKQCQLPTTSLLVPPSESGVDPCIRCQKLEIDCILDDYAKRANVSRQRKRINSADKVEESFEQIATPERLGSRLLMQELVRQVEIASAEFPKSTSAQSLKAASMRDLDALIDEPLVQTLSGW